MGTGTTMSQSSVFSDAEHVWTIFFTGRYPLGQLCHIGKRLAPLGTPDMSLGRGDVFTFLFIRNWEGVGQAKSDPPIVRSIAQAGEAANIEFQFTWRRIRKP